MEGYEAALWPRRDFRSKTVASSSKKVHFQVHSRCLPLFGYSVGEWYRTASDTPSKSSGQIGGSATNGHSDR